MYPKDTDTDTVIITISLPSLRNDYNDDLELKIKSKGRQVEKQIFIDTDSDLTTHKALIGIGQ